MTVPFKPDFSKEIAVVTGGGGILAGIMAKSLAECGAKVAVLDLKPEAASVTAKMITDAGGNAKAFACNVLEKDSLEKANKDIETAFGPATILINGAGGNHPKGATTKEYITSEDLEKKVEGVTTFYDLDISGFGFVLNLNLIGTLLPTQAFTKGMVKAKRGTIINISSMNAFRPLTKIPAYSGAKAAVSNFTQWLAVHFSKAGVRVNGIAPGFFLTDQNRNLLINKDGTPSPRLQKILDHTPLGRLGTPEELAGTMLWLADEKASGFVTGVIIPVDGGFQAYSGV